MKPLDSWRAARGDGAAGDQVPRPGISPIICKPDYTMPAHLDRLRERGWVPAQLAVRGSARRRSAWAVRQAQACAVHECVFGVLMLESSGRSEL